ncbi:hypothetical protein Tco_0397424, partial [Tanacetum coccineum]
MGLLTGLLVRMVKVIFHRAMNLEDNVSAKEISDDEALRRAKRGDSPPNPNGSGGDRHRKKRKQSANGHFEGTKDIRFSHDSVYNATDGVKFTGKLSDLYKVSHEEVVDVETGIENRRTRNEDGVHNVCSISEN